MYTWEITNSNGHVIRIRARDIGDLPAGFGFDEEEIYDTIKAKRISE